MSHANATGADAPPHDYEQYLRNLYRITSDPDRTFDEKLDALFALGCDRFDLEVGAIARVDPAADFWEIENASGDHPRLTPGTRADLTETYCRLAVDETDPVSVSDPVGEGFEGALCYEEFGVSSYLGTRLELDGQADRTFFFVSTVSREQSFTDADRTFLHLIGEWLRKELQRKRRDEQLRRQHDRLESFASMLAHELRNPLTIAQIYLESAVDGDEAAAEEVAQAHDRIEEMIDVLLVTARGTGVNIDREAVRIRDVVADAWDDEATDAADLDVETDRTVRADPTHLRHVFQNLFRNATEHGGDDVAVRVGGLPTGFYVEDDGPGIPEAERETVFQAGYTTDADGTGLGLTYTAQLAETYGWEYELTESDAGGARFEFTDVDFDPEE